MGLTIASTANKLIGTVAWTCCHTGTAEHSTVFARCGQYSPKFNACCFWPTLQWFMHFVYAMHKSI